MRSPEWTDKIPPVRLAGICYLIIVAGGLFSEIVVRGQLIVAGNATATAANIMEQESLYRAGIVASIVFLACNIPVIWVFYRVFRVFDESIANLMVLTFMTAIIVEVANLRSLLEPLSYLINAEGLVGLTESQRAALTYSAVQKFNAGFALSLAFFGAHCLILASLILRSKVIPRIIGAALVLAGIGYIANTFTIFAAPQLRGEYGVFLLLPALIAETSLALWLTFFGVNQARWNEAAMS
ncbi:DUF4386 domain-containing protein [Hyphococcus sp.]|uniref:DUF4386 domain-containing protein n=1 Tax=Hyphococcus sp. TaxID=2038636 RepID=UPI003CCBCE97